MIVVDDDRIAVFFYQDHETRAAAACALCPEPAWPPVPIADKS
jgi:hypothetical protein